MDPLRKQLLDTLTAGQAHVSFEQAVKDFPPTHYASKPEGGGHSAWQLLEHLRITQRDILDFSADPDYKELKWPDEYWPREAKPPQAQSWDESIAAFEKDRADFCALIADPSSDLNGRLPNGDGQTLLREALLIIDHNAYHLGQLITLRVQLGIWPG